MMQWWCTDDALMMHWWCTDDALGMIWCIEVRFLTFIEGSMEVELMVTKRDDNRPTTTDRVNIEQSASGRWAGRVLQFHDFDQHSQFWPNFRTLTKFQDFNQISKFRILTKFNNFDQISEFRPIFRIVDQSSQFWPKFTIFTKFHNFNKAFISINLFFQ